MKKGFRIFTVIMTAFLLIAFMLSLIPAQAISEENQSIGMSSGTTGDCTWTLDDVGTLTISGIGKMDDYSWQWGTGIKNVIIENGVTNIGNYAFKDCKKLTSVTIPESVTDIGSIAFYGCTGLTSIDIPGRVTSITWGAFSGCIGLTSIDIPNGVTSIENYAFYGCTGLTSIDIPDSVTDIGDEVFGNCTGLKSITIPYSVTSIGAEAIYSHATVYGYDETEAERYAKANGFEFVSLGKTPTVPSAFGDLNGDGSIDVLDSTAVQKYASGKGDLTAKQISTADVNNDGMVDILDAIDIQKFAAGIITEFKKK